MDANEFLQHPKLKFVPVPWNVRNIIISWIWTGLCERAMYRLTLMRRIEIGHAEFKTKIKRKWSSPQAYYRPPNRLWASAAVGSRCTAEIGLNWERQAYIMCAYSRHSALYHNTACIWWACLVRLTPHRPIGPTGISTKWTRILCTSGCYWYHNTYNVCTCTLLNSV